MQYNNDLKLGANLQYEPVCSDGQHFTHSVSESMTYIHT